ncbi:hypothetical protein ACLOJK_006264 [Asimina triloba]
MKKRAGGGIQNNEHVHWTVKTGNVSVCCDLRISNVEPRNMVCGSQHLETRAGQIVARWRSSLGGREGRARLANADNWFLVPVASDKSVASCHFSTNGEKTPARHDVSGPAPRDGIYTRGAGGVAERVKAANARPTRMTSTSRAAIYPRGRKAQVSTLRVLYFPAYLAPRLKSGVILYHRLDPFGRRPRPYVAETFPRGEAVVHSQHKTRGSAVTSRAWPGHPRRRDEWTAATSPESGCSWLLVYLSIGCDQEKRLNTCNCSIDVESMHILSIISSHLISSHVRIISRLAGRQAGTQQGKQFQKNGKAADETKWMLLSPNKDFPAHPKCTFPSAETTYEKKRD